jgi:hypothetical protein
MTAERIRVAEHSAPMLICVIYTKTPSPGTPLISGHGIQEWLGCLSDLKKREYDLKHF